MWNWFKRYWKIILSVLGTIAGFVALVVFRRCKASCQRAETALEIAENEKDIAYDQGQVQAVRERIGRVDEQIDKITGQMEDDTKVLKNQKDKIKAMTAQEKLDKFKRLGY